MNSFVECHGKLELRSYSIEEHGAVSGTTSKDSVMFPQLKHQTGSFHCNKLVVMVHEFQNHYTNLIHNLSSDVKIRFPLELSPYL